MRHGQCAAVQIVGIGARRATGVVQIQIAAATDRRTGVAVKRDVAADLIHHVAAGVAAAAHFQRCAIFEKKISIRDVQFARAGVVVADHQPFRGRRADDEISAVERQLAAAHAGELQNRVVRGNDRAAAVHSDACLKWNCPSSSRARR